MEALTRDTLLIGHIDQALAKLARNYVKSGWPSFMADGRFDMQKGNMNRRTYAFGLYSISVYATVLTQIQRSSIHDTRVNACQYVVACYRIFILFLFIFFFFTFVALCVFIRV